MKTQKPQTPFKLVFCFLLFILFTNAHSQSMEFYVAPDGSDEAEGTMAAPFASFAYAKSKVAEFKQGNPSQAVTVYFKGGKYYLSAPVVFTAEDSGTEEGPITYKAYENEIPEILGGIKLTNLSWQMVDANVYKTSVPEGLIFETLFIDGEQKILARYPNYDENAEKFNGTASDCLSAAKVSTWSDPTYGYFHAMHGNLWGGIHYQITGKKNSTEVNLTGGTQNNRGSGAHATYRFVENIFEELDDTNEWYLNRNTSELYYYPPANFDLDNAEIEVAALEQLIVFDGDMSNPIKYISIEGMELKRTIRTFMKTADPLLRSDWTIYRGGVVHFEGTENCSIKDCRLSDLGGNAIFFNHYNKNGLITGCHIYDVGASGVSFVGDVNAVRNPISDVGSVVSLGQLDFTRGPKTNNYPQNCIVDNNLIHNIGTIEKQTAGVQISMSAYITVSRNSVYDVPRAGINISEGTFSGHLIEYNDVFKTVLETSDHGAFNSWGRDRYYSKDRGETNDRIAQYPDLVLLDILDTTVIRNNRWRCDHGWDIDLDDGSSYYHLYNNVCLSGGIKLRDAYHRKVENNVTVNNSLNPHVWLENSGDVVRRNIFTESYKDIGMGNWGTELDNNMFFLSGDLESIQENHGTDENSISGDPLFIDPDNGDFTVAEGSPAFGIGWVNFPMDNFGVQVPELKAIAETPEIPKIEITPDVFIPGTKYMGGIVKNIETEGEKSAVGLGNFNGALIMKSPDRWLFSIVQLEEFDVVLKLDDEEIENIDDLITKLDGSKIYQTMGVWRFQELITIDLPSSNDCIVPTSLDKSKWTLVSTDSEVGPEYFAVFAFDDNENTFWHTQWDPSEPEYPHEIVVDLADTYMLDYMDFQARQGSSHPRIEDFSVYATTNLDVWGEPVLSGRLDNSGDFQSIKLTTQKEARYFKFVGLSGYTRNAAAIAEIYFDGSCIKGQTAQTITFEALPEKLATDPDFSPGATASSGLDVSYSSSNTSVATIVANKIHLISAGAAIITASQSGNVTFSPAMGVTHELVVNKAVQTISFPALPEKQVGDEDFPPGATSTSDLMISYTSTEPNVATIVENNIHIIGEGTSIITALQEGSGKYNAAESVAQTLTVNEKTPLNTLNGLEDVTLHPNPVLNILEVDLKPNYFKEYLIYNIYGKVIRSGEIDKESENLSISFDGISKGVYLLVFKGIQSTKTLKVVRN